MNVRLLIGTLIALAVGVPAAYFWHTHQLGILANELGNWADEAEQEGKWEKSAEYRSRYVRLHPDDAAARVQLAETYDHVAQLAKNDLRRRENAVNYYYEALGALARSEAEAPVRTKEGELRTRLAELLLEKGNLAACLAQVRPLDEKSSRGWRLLALALYRRHALGVEDAKAGVNQPGDAAMAQVSPAGSIGKVWDGREGEGKATVDQAIERALELNPKDIELAVLLANIYRTQPQLLSPESRNLPESERQTRADALVDKAVAADSENPESLLTSFRYRWTYKVAGADSDLKNAVKYGPNNLAVLLTAAEYARQGAARTVQQGGSPEEVRVAWNEAVAAYQRVIAAVASDRRGYIGLGDVFRLLGEPKRAVETWRRGLEKAAPRSVDLHLRLAEALIGQGQPEQLVEADKSLRAIDDVAISNALKEAIGDPARRPAAKTVLVRQRDLLRSQWHLRKGETAEAVRLLQQAAGGAKTSPAELVLSYQAYMMLGNVHAALRQWERAASAYDQASAVQAGQIQPRLLAATAWENAGRAGRAAEIYGQLAAKVGEEKPSVKAAGAELSYRLARAHLSRQSGLPKHARNWAPFIDALAKAKNPGDGPALTEGWRLAVLEAEFTAAKAFEADAGEARERGMREAVESLRKAEQSTSASSACLQAVVPLYERFGASGDADRALETLEKREGVGGQAAVSVLRARLHMLRKHYPQAREVLLAALEPSPPQARPALEMALVEVALREGNLDEAQQRLEALHRQFPTNEDVLHRLADLAIDRQQWDKAKQWGGKLKEVEGPDSAYALYCEIRRLLVAARGPADSQFARAVDLQARLQGQRPAWPRVHVLRGLILEVSGKPAEAVDAYRTAMDLGHQDAFMFERLVALLLQLRRVDEASQYFALLQAQAGPSTRLAALELALAAERGEMGQAEQLARGLAARSPDNPSAHLKYGEILQANKKQKEAEAEFLKSRDLAPTDPRAVEHLVGLYVQMKQPEQGRAILQQFAQSAGKDQNLSELQLALAMGRWLELLGDREPARKQYQEAARLGKDDAQVQMRVAEFLLRGDTPEEWSEAEKTLKHVIKDPKADSGVARRLLAGLLVQRGGKWDEAQQTLEQGDSGTLDAALNRSMQAALLVRRGGQGDRTKARQILENLVKDSEKVQDGDILLLAGLYEAEDKVQLARQQYTALVGRTDPNPVHLAYYVAYLLRQQDLAEADGWLRRLEQKAPDDLGAAGLRAQWLAQSDQSAKIEGVIEPVAQRLLAKCEKDEAREVQLAAAVAKLYEGVSQMAAAKRWYLRMLGGADPGQAPIAMYVDFLLRTKDLDEAGTWLEKLQQKAPANESLGTAGLKASWLHARGETAQIEPLIEPLAEKRWEQYQGDKPKQAQFALLTGSLYSQVQQHRAAERWYQRLRQRSPDRFGPLVKCLADQNRILDAVQVCLEAAKSDNSAKPALILAITLAAASPTEKDYRAAEPLLAKALQDHSGDADLLATVATLRVRQQRTDEAIKLYRQALAVSPGQALTLNNLANLLAEQPDGRSEALRYVEEAISLAGPQASPMNKAHLWDTKGMILLLNGKVPDAVDLFSRAATVPRPDPRHDFHLAVAYYRRANAGDADQARKAFERARRGGLAGQILTDTDRKFLAELEKAFPQ